MVPNALIPIQAETTLEPGGISFTKTATITPGKVNTWDIEVNFESRNHTMTSDIILVMDVSGSMSSNNRLVKTKEAAYKFVDTLLGSGSSGTRIAMVTYSGDATVESNFVTSSGRNSLKNKINNLSADGGTHIQAGLRTAYELMLSSTADIKTIIVLSDGEPTYSYGLKKPVPDSYLEQYSQNYKETKRGIPLDRYDTNIRVGNGSDGFRSRRLPNGNNETFYYNHANAALTESDRIKAAPMNAIVYSIALDLTGTAGDFMRKLASTNGHAFTAGSSNINAVYDQIAGGIKNNTSDVVIDDLIGTGFKLVPNTLSVNNGTTAVSGNAIKWTLGNPTAEYFTGKMTYQIIAVDPILEVTGNNGVYDTNPPDTTTLNYTDNKGYRVKKQADIPTVIPTFFSFEKALVDDFGDTVDDQGYEFNINTMKTGFNRDTKVKPGAENIVRTVQIYDYGTYLNAETAGTLTVSSVTNPLDLDNYNTRMFINGTEKDSFVLDDNNRGNVDIIVFNNDKRVPKISAIKTVSDASGDHYAQPGEILTYELLIKNTGLGRTRGVSIKDELTDLLPYLDDEFVTEVVIYQNGETTPFTTLDRAALINGFKLGMDAEGSIRIVFSVKLKDELKDLQGNPIKLLRNIAIVDDNEPEVEIPVGKPDIVGEKHMKNVMRPTLSYVSSGDLINVFILLENKGDLVGEYTLQDDLAGLLAYVEDPSDVQLNYYVNNTLVEILTLSDLMDGNITNQLEPLQKASYQFLLRVRDDLDFEGVIVLENIALLNDEEITTTIDLKDPRIEAGKFVVDANEDGYAQSKEALTYTISVSNTGEAKAYSVKIQDTLEDLFEYVDFNEDDKLIITTGDFTIRDLMDGFTVDVAAGDTYEFTFTVTTKANIREIIGEDRILHNIAIVGDQTPEVEIPYGDRGVNGQKSVYGESYEDLIFAGEYLNYTIEVWNEKDLLFEDVLVQDTLSELLPYLEAHDNELLKLVSNMDQAFGTYTVKDLKEGLSLDVEPGEKITITFRVLTKDTLDKNVVSILHNAVRINELEKETEIPVGNRSIEASKHVYSEHKSGYAVPGFDVYYEIRVTNTGDGAYKDITVEDKLDFILGMIEDPRDSFVIIRTSDTVMPSLISIADMMDIYTFSIEPGITMSFLFTVSLKEGIDVDSDSIMHNEASVAAINVFADIDVRQEVLNIEKRVRDANEDGYASSGEPLTYTLELHNSGNLLAEDVLVQDTLENILAYLEDVKDVTLLIDSTEHGTSEDRLLSELMAGFRLDLLPDEYVTISFSVTLLKDAVEKAAEHELSTLLNLATLEDEETETSINLKDPNLSIDKYVVDANEDGYAQAGEVLDYEIVVRNQSGVTVDQVTVLDTLEYLIDYLEDISSVEVEVTSNHGRSEMIALTSLMEGYETYLGAEEALVFRFSVMVRYDLKDLIKESIILTNIALVNDTDVTTEIETLLPHITAGKAVSDTDLDGKVQKGETLSYVITIENDGEVEALGVLIQDNLKYLDGLVSFDANQRLVINAEVSELTLADLMIGFKMDIDAGDRVDIVFELGLNPDLDFTSEHTFKNIATVDDIEVDAEIESELELIPDEVIPVENPKPTEPLPKTGISAHRSPLAIILLLLGGVVLITSRKRKERDSV